MHRSETIIEQALIEFKESVKWHKVLANIDRIVLNNIKRPNKFMAKDSITDACHRLKIATTVDEADNYLTLDYRII